MLNTYSRNGKISFSSVVLSSLLLLSGCGGGSSSDDNATSSISQNHAPTIMGTPLTTITNGSSYSFIPTALDIDGDTLVFSIENKPEWATFDTSTGELSGTPTDITSGTEYQNIIISVSDGQETVSLDPFNITVNTEALAREAASLYGSTENENVRSSIIDKEGNLIIVGNTFGTFAADQVQDTIAGDMYILKTKTDGTVIWKKQLQEDILTNVSSVVTDSDNNIYVYGSLYSSSDTTFLGETYKEGEALFIIKYNADGDQQWIKLYDNNEDPKSATKIVLDKDNNIYINGYVSIRDNDFHGLSNLGDDRRSDIFVMKLDSAGEYQWAKVYGDEQDQESHDMIIDDDSNVYITGVTYQLEDGSFDGSKDILILKASSDGTQQWIKQYSSSDNESDEGNSILMVNSDLYIAGTVSSSDGTTGTFQGKTIEGLSDAFVSKVSIEDGSLLTTNLYDNGDTEFHGSDKGITLVSDTDNLYLSTQSGKAHDGYGLESITLFKLTKDGNETSTKEFGAAGDSYVGETIPVSMNILNDSLYIIGTTTASPIYDQTNNGASDILLLKVTK